MRWKKSLVLSCALSVLIIYYINMPTSGPRTTNDKALPSNSPLKQSTERPTLKGELLKYAVNGVVAIATFDATYASMTVNLYLTSYKKFNISNYLFIATDDLGCDKLRPFEAHCFQYLKKKNAYRPSVYNSSQYNKNTCVKPRIVLDSLRCGVDVLLVDLDIVFFRNPLPFLEKFRRYDFVVQIDPRAKKVNSGFFLVRKTSKGIKLFEKVVSLIPEKPTNDQVYVNKALNELQNKIKVKKLPANLFQLGNMFFISGHRMFAGDNPCSQCFLVHNNYIVSLEAKIYRFKEYGLWSVDEHRYYNDVNRKYLTYDNPIDFNVDEEHRNESTRNMELLSLKAALVIGNILNRTVILPKFHCRGAERYKPSPKEMCNFIMHFAIRRFEMHLPVLQTYRESTFLEHPLVPESTKKSRSKPYLIDGPMWHKANSNSIYHMENVIIQKPKRSEVSSVEIKEWFGDESAKVLVFHSLYNEFDHLDKEISGFMTTLNNAVKRSDYMQFRQ